MGKLFGVSLLLAGCVQVGGGQRGTADTAEFEPVPPPSYTPGTKFVYSDGSWQKVVTVDGDLVEWVNHRGDPAVAKNDFTYRNISWANRKFHGRRSFSPVDYLMGSPPDTLWPLLPGNEASYDEKGIWVDEDGVDHRYGAFWHCEVKGQEKVEVPAGEFDTWKLTCSRYSKKERYPGALSWEDKSWWYAPAINNWVIEERDFHSYRSTRRRELVAVMPDLSSLLPDADTAPVKKLFQNVLEYQKRGVGSEWRSEDGLTAISFTPVKTFNHGRGGVCRQYQQTVVTKQKSDTWYGIACKSSRGSWQVPRR